MHTIGDTERRTQGRLITFFQDALGYTYLGDWQSRANNSNIDKALLTDWLSTQGHNDRIIKKGQDKLKRAADVGGIKTLYDANRKVYGLLRYGANVRPDTGQQHITVKLIDWKNPRKNHFGIAEEVTLHSQNTNKRPDLVLYINGIAIGVLELKRSTVSVSEGIRQNITNQYMENIGQFFSTVQLVMAGSESQGIRYTVINTEEKYWLQWKEAKAHPDAGDNLLHRDVSQLCDKARLLEILHDFIVFDVDTKKICRHNQYFSVKAAQDKVQKREGGIIWNTQGSGKSLTMVWLPNGFWNTTQTHACSSSLTVQNSTIRLKVCFKVSTRKSNGRKAVGICYEYSVIPLIDSSAHSFISSAPQVMTTHLILTTMWQILRHNDTMNSIQKAKFMFLWTNATERSPANSTGQ